MLSRTPLVSCVILFTVSLILQDASSDHVRNKGGSSRYSQDSDLNFSQLASKYGYYSEEHTVVTEDGYILTVFRMRGRQCTGRTPPVLLMHGLLLSSDCYLDAGPGAGLAYLLADACYDLWLGNARGNYYGRAHTTLDPDKDAEFWNFSFDQIGNYDMPATIDYILNQTAQEQLSYIGHSQGGGSMFIMCSERTGYCDKINIFIGLAPASRGFNIKSVVSKYTSIFYNKFEKQLAGADVYEVMGTGSVIHQTLSKFCPLNLKCQTIMSFLDSPHPRSVSDSTARFIFKHFLVGTSVHNMAHSGQSVVSKDFKKFDYGAGNIRMYGSEHPPEYNLTATTVPTLVVYGENDGMVDPMDIKWLVPQLPNAVTWLVPDPQWNHFDFIYSKDIATTIFPKIQEYLLLYNNN